MKKDTRNERQLDQRVGSSDQGIILVPQPEERRRKVWTGCEECNGGEVIPEDKKVFLRSKRVV